MALTYTSQRKANKEKIASKSSIAAVDIPCGGGHVEQHIAGESERAKKVSCIEEKV